MLQSFDGGHAAAPASSRADWIALLARAPLPLLQAGLADTVRDPARWLRRPETGLMMVQGRAGGTGERFNLGELTVTRCALRLADAPAPVGVAYVLGRSHQQAELAARADALLQDATQRETLELHLLAPLRRHLAAQRGQRAQRAQATRVDFFTLAREAGGAEDEEGDA